MLTTFLHRSIQLRWWLFTLSIAYALFAIMGYKHFVFDASPRSYFSDDHAPNQRFQAMEATYGRDFRILYMMSAKDGDMFTAEHLSALLDLTEQSWQLPLVRRVDSIANYQHTFNSNDELRFADFISSDLLQQTDTLRERKRLALKDTGLVNRLISADGKHATVVLSLTATGDQREQEFGLAEASYALADTIKARHPGIDIAVTGNLVSNYHGILIAIRDVTVMVPAMFLLMFILLGTFLRSISTVIISLTVASLSAAGAMGTGAWLGIEYSLLAINALIISITIAVAHCIHIFTQFLEELKTSNKRDALTSSLNKNFFAVSMTSLTTIIGFLSLNFNDLPPAIALGNVAAIGTALAWVFSLTVLPAMVLIMPFKARETSKVQSLLISYMGFLANMVIRFKYPIVIAMSLITVSMIGLSFSNILNERFSDMIQEPHVFRSDTAKIDEHFGALYTAHYDMDTGEPDGINNPEYLKNLDKFANYLRQQPEIRSVYSFADVIKRINRSLNNNDEAFYRIPDSRELIAQYILLYELSLPYGLDLNDQLTFDKQRSRLLVTMPAIDTSTLINIEKRIWKWQQNNLPKSMWYEGASMSMIWAHLSQNSLVSSLKGSIIALTLISLILLLVLRSVRYGLVSLVPNLMPAAFGFGMWYFISSEIGLGLIGVVIITIGIVVDDTVHFLVKYKKSMIEHGNNAPAAIRSTFEQIGPALCITTTVLGSGFMVLSLSKIIASSSLGIVTSLILVAAFILDILLLPALLLILDRNRKPVPAAKIIETPRALSKAA